MICNCVFTGYSPVLSGSNPVIVRYINKFLNCFVVPFHNPLIFEHHPSSPLCKLIPIPGDFCAKYQKEELQKLQFLKHFQ